VLPSISSAAGRACFGGGLRGALITSGRRSRAVRAR
jgi:hypothetical protein